MPPLTASIPSLREIARVFNTGYKVITTKAIMNKVLDLFGVDTAGEDYEEEAEVEQDPEQESEEGTEYSYAFEPILTESSE